MKKVNIKEGVVINLNNEEVTITDIMKNVGFYYKNKSGEVNDVWNIKLWTDIWIAFESGF